PMDFRFTPQEQAFREEIRDWLKTNLPDHVPGERMSGDSENMNVYKKFAQRLATKGWVAPHWPKEYGGLGLSVFEQLVFNEEMAEASAPMGYSTIGTGWVGPTLIVYGTDEQKQRFLPQITAGDVMWCQGFSEPNAGSDLASLKTSAVRDGDDYVINGQKIWTSGAHYADWMILIARTDPEAPKHKGISYFLVDMKAQGLTTTPLIDMMDNHAFNEVFFDNVRVPRANLLGEENRGWYMAATTLDFERSSIGGAVGAGRMVRDLVQYCADTPWNGHRLIDESRVRSRLSDAAIEAELGRLLSYRVVTLQSRGAVPNYEASIAKLFNTDMQLRMARSGLEIMGLYGQLDHQDKYAPLKGRFERQYLWQTGLAVGGGTTEIQKNIIAMRGLGLPRQ
ncbi:MAG: acyl-CoA dehydrogenase, partial [Chloroflexi bacterium]|nr:acyl-CoA dehydrogenase [Chloroflexota bacterium]